MKKVQNSFYAVALIFTFWIWSPHFSFAAISLDQIKLGDAGDVIFSFNGNIEKADIKLDFLGDIVQMSMGDVTVYPSKIIQLPGKDLTKIFAYQYSPKQVRFRFSVHGKAAGYRDRFRYEKIGKKIRVQLSENGRQSESGDSVFQSQVSDPKVGVSDETDAAGDAALVEQVLHSKPIQPIVLGHSGQKESIRGDESPILTTAKPLPPIGPALLKVSLLLGVLVGLGFTVKRLKNSKWNPLLKVGIHKQGQMIEVLSTHYLGPKKGITLVRVAGRMLVLGVTDDSIHLITEIGDSLKGNNRDFTGKGMGDLGLSDFSDLLESEQIKPNPAVSVAALASGGTRTKIRTRLEGLKPL